MDGDRRRLLFGLVVGSLLLLSGVVPQPVFASPYQTSEPAPYVHQAVPEDDSQFRNLVDLYGFDSDAARSVESLSPTGQLAVERTIASEPRRDGWLRYELPVCKDSMLACDSVREPPTDFQYGEGTPAEVFTIIESDGDRYLFQTGVQTGTDLSNGLGDQPTATYLWLFGLLPFGVIVIVSEVIGLKTGRRRLPTLITAVGGGLFVAGVAVPYFTVAGMLSYAAIATQLLVSVVGLTLLAAGGLVAQTVQYAGSTGN